MRSLLLILLLFAISSCELVARLLARPCGEQREPSCEETVLLTCEDGFVLEQDCSPGLCNAELGSCEGICGNGVIEDAEACDDKNNTDADGCEADCTLPICGNGIVDAAEACDDGNLINADGCEASCALPACGNSIVDPPEGCDDGNLTDGDGCSSVCAIE